MDLDQDVMDDDLAEDRMELDYDSSESEDTSESDGSESDDVCSDSDDEEMSTYNESSYERLQNLLIAPEKASVMCGLIELRTSEMQDVSSKLLPEITRVMRLFNAPEDEDIQENVGSILINISAGTKETAETIIIAGAIPLIAEKLQKRVNWSGPQKTEVNFVWCLMNLATDGKNPREVLIADGLDKILIDLVDKVPASHLLLISIAALSALEAEIPWELTCRRLPDVLQYIQSSNSYPELDDACRSLAYIVEHFLRQQLPIPNSVMDQVPYLMEYLTHSYSHVRNSSNDVLDAIASGSDEVCQVLLDSNILEVFTNFLDDPGKRDRACMTISKFTAGNARQIAHIIEKGIMAKLVNFVKNVTSDLTTWERASCAIANALDGRRTLEQFRSLVLDGAIEPLCKMLEIHSNCFGTSEPCLKFKTTERLLRCLDQVSIHLPSLQELDSFVVPNLSVMIEEIFTTQGYHTYQRESKNGIIPQTDSELEKMLTLAMKQFSLGIDSLIVDVLTRGTQNHQPRK